MAVSQDFDREMMVQCLELARQAEAEGEVPVGALVVRDGEVVGQGRNQVITLNDPSAHAEMQALRAAGQHLGNYRLPGCTLYVTLEPCCMCAGALVHARLERVVYGAPDPKTGADGGAFDLLQSDRHNHRIEVSAGLMADESGQMLRDFFRRRR